MSRQDTYMRQWSGRGHFESTDDRFSRGAVYTATQQYILVDAYRT